MKALILGCGYLGKRVASRWLDAGVDVAALTRSTERADDLRRVGISPLLGDVTDPASLAVLPTADVVLYAVGFDRGSGDDRRAVVVEGLRNTLAAIAGRCGRLVFISTTSVYGQSQGEWIDEDSPTTPTSDAGRLALDAETIVNGLSRDQGECVTILRLSGLYGPGRLLRRVEQLRANEPIAGDGDAWLNLIHVDDAATAVVRAAATEDPLRTPLHHKSEERSRRFLVSDDCPVRRRDYYGRLAELVGAPPPVFDRLQSSRSTGLGKRCRNTCMKDALGVSLRFPTCEAGLAAEVSRESMIGDGVTDG